MEILGFRGGEDVDVGIPGSNAVWTCTNVSEELISSILRAEGLNILAPIFRAYYGGNIVLRSVRRYLQFHTVLQLIR